VVSYNTYFKRNSKSFRCHLGFFFRLNRLRDSLLPRQNSNIVLKSDIFYSWAFQLELDSQNFLCKDCCGHGCFYQSCSRHPKQSSIVWAKMAKFHWNHWAFIVPLKPKSNSIQQFSLSSPGHWFYCNFLIFSSSAPGLKLFAFMRNCFSVRHHKEKEIPQRYWHPVPKYYVDFFIA